MHFTTTITLIDALSLCFISALLGAWATLCVIDEQAEREASRIALSMMADNTDQQEG